jgi:hypothetical protein
LKKISTITDEELDELIIEKKSHIANLMGIRSLAHYLKTVPKIWVGRDLVQKSLHRVDPGGVLARQNRRLVRRIFHSRGPNEILSCDGHDKLLRWGFGIHGGIDVFSRYMIWLRIGITNSDPRAILSYFLDSLDEHAGSDNGTAITCLYYFSYKLLDIN